MLTGSNPFRGGNYTQTVVNHVQMEPPPPDSLGAFRGVLARMLAKKPDERFADCRALLAALDEVELSDLEETQIRPALALPEPGGRSCRVSLLPASIALPLLVVLSVSDDNGRRHKLLVWPDAVPADTHRALRVYVRWCRGAGNPETERM